VAFDLNDNFAGGFTELGQIRVLIVDDFEPWRATMRKMLEDEQSFEIVGESEDGLDAIEKSSLLQPDLVILDIGLPGMNGLKAARRIGVVSPDSKLLFVSANVDHDVIQEAVMIGAGFVSKSDAANDLLPLIKAILDGESFLRFKILDDEPR
jgi:DNA-binding NarL/FixJ family response regulator